MKTFELSKAVELLKAFELSKAIDLSNTFWLTGLSYDKALSVLRFQRFCKLPFGSSRVCNEHVEEVDGESSRIRVNNYAGHVDTLAIASTRPRQQS